MFDKTKSKEQLEHETREKLLERQSEARVIRKIVLIISLIFSFIILGAIGGGYFYIHTNLKPLDVNNTETKAIEIPIGSSSTTIGKVLEKEGIIRSGKIFRYYVKFKNETGFMAGTYELSPSMDLDEIVSILKTGKVTEEVVFKLIIPEGKQLEQIASIIAEKMNWDVTEVMNELNSKEFIKKMQQAFPNLISDEIYNSKIKYPLEGYLFPATYSFYKEDPTLEEIVKVMINKTDEVIKEYNVEISNTDWTIHQVLTFASLVEEEATASVDRNMIASVFYNRMEVGMPLQTDPTILYALGQHQDVVLYKDLEVESPYNTYKYTGLTPGPIANAGKTSIEAVLFPAESDYYYFLATPKGEVLYSKTLAEHNEKKAKYLK